MSMRPHTIPEMSAHLQQLVGEIQLLRKQMGALQDQITDLIDGPGQRLQAIANSDELDADQAAQLLGVGRRYFVDELSKRVDFPKPSTNLSNKTRKWRYNDLIKVKAPKKR